MYDSVASHEWPYYVISSKLNHMVKVLDDRSFTVKIIQFKKIGK